MIPESFIEELKYASNIEQVIGSYVTINRKGRNLVGLCPFHSEKSPSFTVYPESQSYYCFGCGSGGDIITFIKHVENLDYVESIKLLAQRVGLTIPESTSENLASQIKKKVLEINRETAKFFHQQLLSPSGKLAQEYLLGRGLTAKTIRTFGVGYAPEGWNNLRDYLKGKGFRQQELIDSTLVVAGRNNGTYDMFRDRIIFPIIDLRGNVIAFGGRIMNGSGPKYLNSSDTPVFKKSRNLFSLNFAKASDSDTLILGEGYMDVIAMYQAGFTNSVATLGTSLTDEQARLISQYAKKVVIAYDSDGAGQSAAKRAINLFSQVGVNVTVLQMEGAKDPDEYIKKFGASRFQNLIDGGKSAMDFEIDKLKAKNDLSSPEGKLTFLDSFCSLMSEVNNPLQRDIYIGEIAREIDVGKERIISAVESQRKRKSYSAKRQESRDLSVSASRHAGTLEKPPPNNDNLGGVKAEEKLLTLLMRHPDYYKYASGKISSRDFSDEGFSKIYAIIEERLEQNLSLDLVYFSKDLPDNLMGKLSQLLVKGQAFKFYPTQVDDYISAINQNKNRQSTQDIANMSAEEYDTYMDKLRAKK